MADAAPITADAERSDPRRATLAAIGLMAVSSLCFAGMGVCVKASTARLPFLVAVLFRSVVGLLPMVAFRRWMGASYRPRQHGLLFLRSAFGFAAMCCFFLAIEWLPLSTATVLNSSSPVFVVLLSWVVLEERAATAVLPLVLAAFAGVALLVSPEFGEFGGEVAVGLLSALLAAMAYVTIKRLSATESPGTIVLWFGIWSSLLAAGALVLAVTLGWTDLSLEQVVAEVGEPVELLLLCGIGVLGTLGQVFLTSSYARERASVVSPFQYLVPVFSYGFGLGLFGETASLERLGGGAIVIAASVGVLRVSRRE